MENNEKIRSWAERLERYNVPCMVMAWAFFILWIVHPHVKLEGAQKVVASTLNDFQFALCLVGLLKDVQFKRTGNDSEKNWLDKILARKKIEGSPIEQAMHLEACKIESRIYKSLSNIALAISTIVSYLLILH